MSDFAPVFRTYDPVTADLAEQLLVAHDVQYRRLGSRNAASFGAGDSLALQAFEVAAVDAERAGELLAALVAPVEAESEPVYAPTRFAAFSRVLARAGLFAFFGLVAALPLAFLSRWSQDVGLAKLHLISGLWFQVLAPACAVFIGTRPNSAAQKHALIVSAAALVASAVFLT
jgi:hypothetical protein